MSIGWPIGSIIAGRAMLRFGSRPVVVVGTGLLVVGSALLTQAAPVQALWYSALGAGITGFGMGLTTTPLLVSIQTVVAWNKRGQATGLVQFSRTIGGAVGTGLMGAILASAVGPQASAVLDPVGRGSIGADELATIRESLANGLGLIFIILLVTSVAAWLLAIRFMPAIHVDDVEEQAPEPVKAPAAMGQATYK
jgi:MFS family permease